MHKFERNYSSCTSKSNENVCNRNGATQEKKKKGGGGGGVK